MFKAELKINANEVAGMLAAQADKKIESYEGLEHLAESEKKLLCCCV